jgi:hypothetical protein
VDSAGDAVMMGWEAPLMTEHAEVLCPKGGRDVCNIGFGLGLIDTELQKRNPRCRVCMGHFCDHLTAGRWEAAHHH